MSGKGTIAEVEKVIGDGVAALAKTPPTDDEMTKVRHQLASGFLFGLASNNARAAELARYELYYGDASLLNAELDKYLAVTKNDVTRVVAKYLVPDRRSRVEVKPAQTEAKPAADGATPKASKQSKRSKP